MKSDLAIDNATFRASTWRAFPLCIVGGALVWAAGLMMSAIALGLGGIRPTFEAILVAVAGPLGLISVLGPGCNLVILAAASLIAFIFLQRRPLGWVWCLAWTATGIAIVFWATHIISIT